MIVDESTMHHGHSADGDGIAATVPPAGSMGHRHRRSAAKPPLSRPELRRLARRGGVLRMGQEVPETMRQVLRSFLTGVIKDAVVFAEHSRRKTIATRDVVLALKRSGNSSWHTILYGFDDDGSTVGMRRRRRRRTNPVTAVVEPVTADASEPPPETVGPSESPVQEADASFFQPADPGVASPSAVNAPAEEDSVAGEDW